MNGTNRLTSLHQIAGLNRYVLQFGINREILTVLDDDSTLKRRVLNGYAIYILNPQMLDAIVFYNVKCFAVIF